MRAQIFSRTFSPIAIIVFALLVAFSSPAVAVNPDEILADPVMETRARAISAELRCLVCQNQSIDDSDASLARDLRLLVRERIVAGDSDAEVVAFVVDRYGEFVLLKPYMGWHTFALWATAPVVLLLSILVLVLHLRNKKTAPTPPPTAAKVLTKEEQDALNSLSSNQ
ncbi:MAG TPA: cytochrome c-type biogenesis protein CcmH [Devosia sp.]|nr:cytochrome c-type biogenesis protein CcmH [Devosia sp.]